VCPLPERSSLQRPSLRLGCLLLVLGVVGCSSLPPGAGFPKSRAVTVPLTEPTRLGATFQPAVRGHESLSGFHIFPVGVDGLLTRIELIRTAEHSLDLQYYIFRGDETGALIRDELKQAAARGVHVRVLVDDADTVRGDERLFELGAVPNVEIRVYNPWAYRGHVSLFRNLEYLTHHSRLDYRMHNKLLIVDQVVALAGGRNIGDQYFQVDPGSQFADDDVFTVGADLAQMQKSFDEFWNSDLAIPSEALNRPPKSSQSPEPSRLSSTAAADAGMHLREKLANGEPLKSLLSGSTQLVWAQARVVYDSPNKKDVREGIRAGRLMYGPVAEAAASAQQEMLVITPYLVPAHSELKLLEEQRARNARVAILTNSLESAPEVSAHAGYMHYRPQLLREGVELYEVRSHLESTRGSGQSKRISQFGNYALHAKLFVFDRKRLFIGSMNFDQRSHALNTELGLVIDSTELAQQTVTRFEAMTQPESAYTVSLEDADPKPGDAKSDDPQHGSHLVWSCREQGRMVELTKEPARSSWQRFEVGFLSWLPLDREL
jgi:putative cardiolipin synthase